MVEGLAAIFKAIVELHHAGMSVKPRESAFRELQEGAGTRRGGVGQDQEVLRAPTQWTATLDICCAVRWRAMRRRRSCRCLEGSMPSGQNCPVIARSSANCATMAASWPALSPMMSSAFLICSMLSFTVSSIIVVLAKMLARRRSVNSADRGVYARRRGFVGFK